MTTGDGLLVRLHPASTIAISAFTGLCRAAQRHGNSVIEVTSRGSIQVRGLNARSAPQFAGDVATLGIAADDGVTVHCNPLTGIGADEIFDTGALASDLRQTLSRRSVTAKLSPKVTVAIDGGGALSLATLSADIRLCAQMANGNVTLRVGIGGDGKSATHLGTVALADGVEATVRLLEVIAGYGRNARARDIVATEGIASFRDSLSSYACGDIKGADGRNKSGHDGHPIGSHPLRDGSFACGAGLPFGHSDAATLQRLAIAAAEADASGFRPAPERVLMAIGLRPDALPAYAAAAAQLGFIVRPDDPHRQVVACAGAPICASAHIAARAIAPIVAESIAELGRAFAIHISGCAKGCAHAAPAALTVVGTPEGCALVADGSARDTSFATVPADDLPAAISDFVRARKREAGHV